MSAASPYAARLASIPTTEHSVSVLGSTTRYWEYGTADAATTVVVVHGFRGDHHGLEPVVAHLCDGSVRVISPDLPGFGQSDALSGIRHDIDGYGRWLREFLRQVDAEDAAVLGHSFGSIVVAGAAAAGLAAPRLILVNPIAAPALKGPSGVLTRLAVFYYWLAAALPERLGFGLLRNRVIVRAMSVAMAKTRQKGLRRFIHDQHDRYFSAFSDRRVVLEAFQASVSSDVSSYARRIAAPVLLVAAGEDQITPVAAQHRLQALFEKNAELVIIPRVGHLIHYETPAPAADAIRAFLAETARS